jgi:hypothetical protein
MQGTEGALDGKLLAGVFSLGKLHEALPSHAPVDMRQNAEPIEKQRRVWKREIVECRFQMGAVHCGPCISLAL